MSSSLQGASANAAMGSPSMDSDDQLADQRMDEIVLNQALAKSSNVTTPELEPPTVSTSQKDSLSRQASALSSTLRDELQEGAEGTTPATTSTSSNPGAIAAPMPTRSFTPLPFEEKLTPSMNVEDDFFSMSFTAPPGFHTKKKKKKKAKREKSATISDSKESTPVQEPLRTSPRKKKQDTIPTEAPDGFEVIVLTDDDGPAKEKKKPKRALTPPPFDEQAYKRSLAEKSRQQYHNTLDLDPEFDDMEDEATLKRLKRVRKMTESMPVPSMETALDRADTAIIEEDVVPNQYKLHITSFLPGSEDTALDLDLKGNKKFGSVVSKVLRYLLGLEIVHESLQHVYSPDNVLLFWNDMKIMDFMKPDTLGVSSSIPGEPIRLEMGLYTKAQAERIAEEKEIAKQQKLEEIAREEERARQTRARLAALQASAAEPDFSQEDDRYKEIDEQIEMETAREASLAQTQAQSATPTVAATAEPEDDAEGYFKIGMKGGDNKKLVVRVNAETQMTKLVAYYLEKKALPANTKVRLVFDDEDIPLTACVGDTELEEDFTIEVYVR